MAKVKLSLARIPVEHKIPLGNTIHAGMTGNANFPSPTPSLPDYAAVIANLTAKHAAYLSLLEQVKAALDDRNAAEALYDAATTQLGAYAEGATGGDLGKLASGGFPTRKIPAPLGPLDEVRNLSVQAGAHEGTLRAKWKPTRGAKSYEVQVCPDPIAPEGWRSVEPTSNSRYTIGGLNSGTKIWVRVRAIAKGPAGPWSDPAIKTVP